MKFKLSSLVFILRVLLGGRPLYDGLFGFEQNCLRRVGVLFLFPFASIAAFCGAFRYRAVFLLEEIFFESCIEHAFCRGLFTGHWQ